MDNDGTPKGGNPAGTTIFGGQDISTLPEELQELAKQANDNMQKDYNSKMETIANDRKDWESKLSDSETKYNKALEVNKEWDEWNRSKVEPILADYYTLKGQSSGTDNTGDSDYSDDEATKLKALEERMRAEYQTALGSQVSRVGNLIGAMNQLNDLRFEHRDNPDFDINKVIETAKTSGITDLKTAYTLAYGESDRQIYAEKQVNEAKEKWEQERAAQEVNVLGEVSPHMTNPIVSAPTSPISKKGAIDKTMKQMAEKYGTDFWSVFRS